jgi:hypothetical protein
MSEYAPRSSVLRLALYGIGIAVIVGLLARYVQHRHSTSISLQTEPPSAVPAPDASRPVPAPSHPGRAQILAGCQPHLSEGSTVVPNIAVTDRYNMAAVRLKVRFWVNGDGFVTRAFVDGFTVATAGDQEAELDFVQHLTFTVPGTEECQTRSLEMIGIFSESRESGGEWATVLDVHPLYAFEGDQVVVRP